MIVVYSIAVMVVAETKIHNIEKSTSCCRPIFAFFIFFLLSFQTPKIEQWCAFNEYGLWNESKAWSTSFVLQMSICTPRQMILCVVLSLPCLAGVLSICNERLVLTRTWTGACVVMKRMRMPLDSSAQTNCGICYAWTSWTFLNCFDGFRTGWDQFWGDFKAVFMAKPNFGGVLRVTTFFPHVSRKSTAMEQHNNGTQGWWKLYSAGRQCVMECSGNHSMHLVLSCMCLNRMSVEGLGPLFVLVRQISWLQWPSGCTK